MALIRWHLSNSHEVQMRNYSNSDNTWDYFPSYHNFPHKFRLPKYFYLNKSYVKAILPTVVNKFILKKICSKKVLSLKQTVVKATL